ncbi:hypothetical protein RCL1_005484 [Eukaryota sp. TZLM3-RCL]
MTSASVSTPSSICSENTQQVISDNVAISYQEKSRLLEKAALLQKINKGHETTIEQLKSQIANLSQQVSSNSSTISNQVVQSLQLSLERSKHEKITMENKLTAELNSTKQ